MIKPPAANQVFLQYQLNNVPKAENNCKWIEMKNTTVYRISTFIANINKSEDVFLHTKYRIIYVNGYIETE